MSIALCETDQRRREAWLHGLDVDLLRWTSPNRRPMTTNKSTYLLSKHTLQIASTMMVLKIKRPRWNDGGWWLMMDDDDNDVEMMMMMMTLTSSSFQYSALWIFDRQSYHLRTHPRNCTNETRSEQILLCWWCSRPHQPQSMRSSFRCCRCLPLPWVRWSHPVGRCFNVYTRAHHANGNTSCE